MKSDLQDWVIVLVAILGGLARQSEDFLKGKIRWEGWELLIRVIARSVVSGFLGIMVYNISQSAKWDVNVAFAFAGVCGWLGSDAMVLLMDLVYKKTNLNTNKEKE